VGTRRSSVQSNPFPQGPHWHQYSGNYCAFLLLDHQFTATSSEKPDHGLYGGFSVLQAPSEMNRYSQYYEARLYRKAPFNRPSDLLSLVASHTGYSRFATSDLIAEGKTVSHGSNSVTAGYNARLFPGAYLGLGLGVTTGPALSPRLSNSQLVNTHFFGFLA
jgi:porin